jgi:predicted negative regulator of RcsB-dependent stress response
VNYRASLAIREALLEKDKTNAIWQQDRALSHSKIGEALAAQGDRVGAIEAYRASADIRRKLLDQDPTNTRLQGGLGVLDAKIGDVLLATGDKRGALAAYQAGRDLFRSLSKADPSDDAPRTMARDLAQRAATCCGGAP